MLLEYEVTKIIRCDHPNNKWHDNILTFTFTLPISLYKHQSPVTIILIHLPYQTIIAGNMALKLAYVVLLIMCIVMSAPIAQGASHVGKWQAFFHRAFHIWGLVALCHRLAAVESRVLMRRPTQYPTARRRPGAWKLRPPASPVSTTPSPLAFLASAVSKFVTRLAQTLTAK